MKASYEFVLLSLLVAFSWESPLNTQPPKQSVRQVDLEEDSIPKRAISEDSGCYDQSPSCSYWALTGQCHNNPNLQRTCCVWCNHMKTLLQVKYFSCHDKSSVHDCYRWAIQDECYKNPAFMLQFCCNSCRIEDVVIPW
ncbi:uncharacterized protein [Porites lutea]|uniref:uncharacterized protein n=1 Tax=Porites lutea TaxID=51062 RepID=UPI003CC5AE35